MCVGELVLRVGKAKHDSYQLIHSESINTPVLVERELSVLQALPDFTRTHCAPPVRHSSSCPPHLRLLLSHHPLLLSISPTILSILSSWVSLLPLSPPPVFLSHHPLLLQLFCPTILFILSCSCFSLPPSSSFPSFVPPSSLSSPPVLLFHRPLLLLFFCPRGGSSMQGWL